MGKVERSNRTVVCLENSLEVKGKAIPERKFSRGRTSEYTAALGRPLCRCRRSRDNPKGFKVTHRYDIYRASHFIGRRVNKFCAKGS